MLYAVLSETSFTGVLFAYHHHKSDIPLTLIERAIPYRDVRLIEMIEPDEAERLRRRAAMECHLPVASPLANTIADCSGGLGGFYTKEQYEVSCCETGNSMCDGGAYAAIACRRLGRSSSMDWETSVGA